MCLVTLEYHCEPVSSCAWAPDGQTFVTGSLDRHRQLCLWDTHGRRVYDWHGNYRVQDCAISPDGQRLITISYDKRIFVYNFNTREEEYCITSLKVDLTSLNISSDSRYMLVSTSDDEVQLIEIDTAG